MRSSAGDVLVVTALVLCIAGVAVAERSMQSATSLRLPDGLMVDVRFPVDLHPRDLCVGDDVTLSVARDVRVAGFVVIPKAAVVRARVDASEERGVVGSAAQIDVVILSTTAVDGTIVPLSGIYSAKGAERRVESVAFAWSVCLFGLFIPGEDASIAESTLVACFVEGPIDIAVSSEIPHD